MYNRVIIVIYLKTFVSRYYMYIALAVKLILLREYSVYTYPVHTTHDMLLNSDFA